MSTTPALDPVSVATLVAAAVFAPDVAAVLGPYSVVFLGAVLGASWAQSRRPSSTRLEAVGMVLRLIGLALLVTVPLANLAAGHIPVEAQSLLGVVAMVVGGVGHDWPRVGAWALGLVRTLIEKKANS